MNRRFVTFVYTLMLFSASALAAEETRSVETTVAMPADPDKVMQAFLDDADLKGWWKISRSLVEPKVGGIWSITWDDWGEEKTQHAWIGVIEELSDDRLLVGRLVMIEPDMPLLGPLQLEISVAAADGGTSLTVSHRGYRYGDHWDTIYEMVVNGWDHVLGDMQTWFSDAY